MRRCEFCDDEAKWHCSQTVPDEPEIEIVNESRVRQFAKLGYTVVLGQEIRWAKVKLIATHYCCDKHVR